MRREIYIGTSGWLYDWNRGASLDWYVRESRLNAVELNASFYRFPLRSQVRSWLAKGGGLRWSVKVHRSITHMRRLSREALDTWRRFHDLFEQMEGLIDFYLFQLPPSYACEEEKLERIRRFSEEAGLGWRMAVEFRHESCFSGSVARWAEESGVTVVSIDSPIATWIVSVNNTVYLRMHGRGAWYSYGYSGEELRGVAEKLNDLNPRRIYVFFNNDHWMLDNARYLKKLLEEAR